MGYTTRPEWDAHYAAGRSFRPLGAVERTLLDTLAPAPPGGGRALDVGCGLGELARHLATTGYHVDAVDHSPAALAAAQSPTTGPLPLIYHRLDIEHDPLDRLSTYDLITFRLSFAFLRDRTRTVNRLRERLRPGGALIVITLVADAVPAERRETALDDAEIDLLTAGWRGVERRDAEGPAFLVLRDPVQHPVAVGADGHPKPHALTGAGVVVTDERGRVLLGRSVRRDTWELPGGKNDPGESFEQAAVRELAEETGLTAAPSGARLLALLMDSVHGMPRLTAAVRVTAFTGEPAVLEPHLIRRWEWHEVTDLPTLAGTLFTPSAHVLDTVWPGLLPPLPPIHRHRLLLPPPERPEGIPRPWSPGGAISDPSPIRQDHFRRGHQGP